MSADLMTGMFTLAGALIGGLTTYATTRINRRWDQAHRNIARLCDEVAAYYQLEQLYKTELAATEGKGRNPKTVMEEMRARVAESGDFVRPTMTSNGAQKLRREWT